MFASIIAAEEAAAAQVAAAQQAQKKDTGVTTTATVLETGRSATSNRDFDPPTSAVGITIYIVGIIVPAADLVNAGISAYNGDYVGAGANVLAVVPMVGDLAKWGRKIVKITRKAPGSGRSWHLIESIEGKTISVTHQVEQDGRIIHQHQRHIEEYGVRRSFPNEWVEYPDIDMP